jgi:outer membrane protein
MSRAKNLIIASLAPLLFAPGLWAQLSTVAVVDFERAVVENEEGKKASDKFNAEVQARQSDLEKRQREIEDLQKKQQVGVRTLSEAAKADLQRDIDRRTRDLQRINEDAQKDLQVLRDQLLRPIAERATAILNAMAAEKGYTVVVDTSDPNNNVLWANPQNEITAELVKRINASKPPETAKPEPPPKPAPTTSPAPKSATPAPTSPKE